MTVSKRAMAVILKDDYGDPKSGLSYEYNYFYRTLEQIFAECQLFDYGPYLKNPGELQNDILAAADAFQPDVMFFLLFKGEFAPETLDHLKSRFVTVNWFSDDQWRFDAFSSKVCHHFSHIVTTDHYAPQKYQAVGYDKAILSQWAAFETRDEFAGNPDSYRFDVSFVGMNNPFRTWLVRELEKRGLEIACFGTGWPKGRIPYRDIEDVFRYSKINLNISNSRNFDIRYVFSGRKAWKDYRSTRKTKEQIKGRHFEIPACGGFQLTNYVEFLEDYLQIGKEVAVYNALDDLADKIQYYLERDSLRQEIARAGYERTRKDHTYLSRFTKIFQTMGVLEC